MSGTGAEQPRTWRGIRIVLFVSLALNLAVAGLVLGAVASHRFGRDDHPSRLDRAGGPLTEALSAADRRAIAKALRQAAREERPTRADIRAEYQAVIAALRARPYDAEALREAVERQSQGLKRRVDLGREILLHRLAGMSDDERAAFAGRLEAVIERGPKPRGGREAPGGRRLPFFGRSGH